MSSAEDPETLLRLKILALNETRELISAALFDAGATGIEEVSGGLIVYPRDESQLAHFKQATHAALNRVTPTARCEVKLVSERIKNNWQETWQNALSPKKITPSLTLRPTHAPETGTNERTIWYEPACSFGSGEHATTRLAATWLEENHSQFAGERVFDVGTGTGVLSIVAALFGASQVLAVDIDGVAVESARRNVELNGVETKVRILNGSADASRNTFPLVVANINTPILRVLANQLCKRVQAGGTLLLTGLLCEDEPELTSLYDAHGIELQRIADEEGWALLTGTTSSEPGSNTKHSGRPGDETRAHRARRKS